jgi:hypothetical protein
MDEKMRLNLDKMIKEYDAEETTEKIRNLKHSKLIGDDVNKMIHFRKKYSRLIKTNYEQFKQMARKQCNFLYNNYTNIFNRLLKDELNLNILANFLSVLKRIEDGKIDQHEGSYEIGLLLKKLYIDSALKQKERGEKKYKQKKKKKKTSNITWSRYKELGLSSNSVAIKLT